LRLEGGAGRRVVCYVLSMKVIAQTKAPSVPFLSVTCARYLLVGHRAPLAVKEFSNMLTAT